MIARIWHGYTKPEHADAYEAMLKPELLPGVSKVKGYRGSYLLRREAGGESNSSQLCCPSLAIGLRPRHMHAGREHPPQRSTQATHHPLKLWDIE